LPAGGLTGCGGAAGGAAGGVGETGAGAAVGTGATSIGGTVGVGTITPSAGTGGSVATDGDEPVSAGGRLVDVVVEELVGGVVAGSTRSRSIGGIGVGVPGASAASAAT
jgi:hypothetical protein